MGEDFQAKELREFIDMKLRDPVFLKELYKELRTTHSKAAIEAMESEDLYRTIVKRGLLEHLVTQSVKPGDHFQIDDLAPPEVPLDDVVLKVTIVEGKGFTDYLDKADPRKKIKVSVSFLKNRRVTRPVQTSSNPIIDQVGSD